MDNLIKSLRVIGVMAVFSMIAGGSCWANVEQVKIYKAAFEGGKPKCIDCHVVKLPKKGEGEHDFNAYGLKVKETAEEPTEETYKEVGTIEDFKIESEQ